MKSFDEIYENIKKNSKDSLKDVRIANIIYIIVILALIVALIIAFFNLSSSNKIVEILVYGIIGMIILIAFLATRSNKDVFREKIVRPIIKELGKDLQYVPYVGLQEKIFKQSGLYYSDFDIFNSRDKIFGTLSDNSYIELSEITTASSTSKIDNKGIVQPRNMIMFQGMFGRIKLKEEFLEQILIEPNDNSNKLDNARAELESVDFENTFDLFSTNKVVALQVFTSELVEKYIDFFKKTGLNLEVSIKGKYIYFRINCGEMFDISIFQNPMNKELIRKYYLLLFCPLELLKYTADAVNRVNKLNKN